MKKLFVTTMSSVLTLSSLVLTIAPQANALNSASQGQTPFTTETTFPSEPQPILSESSSEKLMAYAMYCETRTNGYVTMSCCVDEYGNWACVY